MRLALDLHGVIMHLMPVMQKYYKEKVGFELKELNRFNFNHPKWYSPTRFGIDIAAAIRTMAFEHANPCRGSIPALIKWRDKGNKIIIVTASANSTMDANEKWLDERIGNMYAIHRVSHKEGKLKRLKKLGVTHFVDDRFKTCNDLADHLEHLYLFDAPCNRGRTPKANVTRVHSLQKVFNLYSHIE